MIRMFRQTRRLLYRWVGLAIDFTLLDERSTANDVLENNPEVMTSLVHNLGLSTSLSFHDVFSIDDPDLLSFIPRPACALLLVFPVSKSYETFRFNEDKDRPEYTGKGDGEDVIWYKQTIRNACGLIGLLHAVSNGSARGFVGMSSHA
jgi:ubiquitin carboxyl-terminal hydrolase L3